MAAVWGEVWGDSWADVWGVADAATAPVPAASWDGDSAGSMAAIQPRRKVRRVVIDPPPFIDPLQQAREQSVLRELDDEELLLSIGVL